MDSLYFAAQRTFVTAVNRPPRGSYGGVSARRTLHPRHPARAYGAPRQWACRPQTPRAAPLVRRRAHRHLPMSINAKGVPRFLDLIFKKLGSAKRCGGAGACPRLVGWGWATRKSAVGGQWAAKLSTPSTVDRVVHAQPDIRAQCLRRRVLRYLEREMPVSLGKHGRQVITAGDKSSYHSW